MTEPAPAVQQILATLAAFAEDDFEHTLERVGDGLDPIRDAVNALGVALARSRLQDADFDVLLDQLMAIASLDLEQRTPEDRGTESYRALAMGLNFLTEELQSVLRSLATAEQRYRTAFLSAPIGMAMADGTGGNLQVNPAFARFLGYEPDDFPFERWEDVTHPEDRAVGREQMQLLTSGEIDYFEMEKRYLTIDGGPIWGHVSVVGVWDDEGTFLHTIAQIVDIDSLKRTMQALQEALDRAYESDRLKTEFVRNMSHEIRTPMTSILGMTELALATKLDPEVEEYLELARLSGHALVELVDDLLSLSTIEAGRMEPSLVSVDPRATVEDAVRPLAVQAATAGLDVSLSVGDGLPARVVCDPGWIGQIVTNLVGNAVKFTEAGEVRVSVDAVPQPSGIALQISVADTGIGVPDDRRHLIFEPFSQADGSTTRSHGGTGLGLAISQRLAGLMGGRIWLGESAPGGGSTFHALLPVAGADAPSAESGEVAAGSAAVGHGRVLVAEDNYANRLLLSRLLDGAGFEVVAVADGESAVAAAVESRFTAVLMDLQMPGMDGLEAVAAIRAKEGDARRVPIVAVTAYALERDRDLALAAGADGFLSKPFTGETLMASLRAVLPDS